MGPARFGRYQVTGTLGSGAMGEVYAATDEVLGRSVAVKTLRSRETGLAARMLDERFRLEARAVAALNHPGIVQVFDIDLAAEPPYLVMEKMAGASLRDRVAKGAMRPNEVREVGVQIARALAAAHEAGIVHRDVKPANILATEDGRWKLADFGVAHVPDSTLTMTGQFIGSPAYAPPEALLRGQTTAAGDVFGLGATLYFAALGQWPRAEATTGALLAPVPSLRGLAPHLPADLVAIIDRAVAIEPDQRPTAGELADALAGAPLRASSPPISTVFVPDDTTAGATAVLAHPPAVSQNPQATPPGTVFVPDLPSPPAASRRQLWWIAGVVGLVAIVIIAASSRSSSEPAAAPGAIDAAAPMAKPEATGDPEPTPDAHSEPGDDEEPLEPPPPGQIRAVTPPLADRRAAGDWNKVVEALYEGKLDKASEKLAQFQRRWGESRETKYLRQQLDAVVQPDD